MEDFAKLMGQQGVRRLGERVETPKRQRIRQGSAAEAPPPAPARPIAPAAPAVPEAAARPEPAAPPHAAWAMGQAAVRTVQIALSRCMVERGGITLLVREEGLLVSRRGQLHPTVGDLAMEADRTGAELVVIEGRGWKTIMHPASGVATLVDDPEDRGEE